MYKIWKYYKRKFGNPINTSVKENQWKKTCYTTYDKKVVGWQHVMQALEQ